MDQEQDDKKRGANIFDNPDVSLNGDGTITLQLFVPVQWGQNEVIEELVFRRPKVKDLKAAQRKDKMEESIHIIARVTGRTPVEIEELDIADITTAGEIIEFFTMRSRLTGGSGSERLPVS